jgi:hypothetical protein
LERALPATGSRVVLSAINSRLAAAPTEPCHRSSGAVAADPTSVFRFQVSIRGTPNRFEDIRRMRSVTRCIAALLLLAGFSAATAQQAEPAKVMLFGVFHFANPGLDVVKTEQIDVMTDENQAYLEALSERLSSFRPTVVLLEFNPARDAEMRERFQQYRDGQYVLPENEVYQLGFRVAARSKLNSVHGFDEADVQWQAEPLFEYMQTKDPTANAKVSALIEEITQDEQQAQASLSLPELLMRTNDPERDKLNRAFYVLTNEVGDGNEFLGADASASWWHRNLRMYALVQRHAQPGERVLVIGGQGHMAILRQLLDDDRDRQAIDVRPYIL